MLLSLLLLLQATPAAAAEPAAQPKEKLICRTITQINSRIGGKRVCATAAEWRQQDLAAQRNVQTIQESHVPTR